MADTQARERQYATQERGEARPFHGTVVSTTNAKTIVVSIERKVMHRKYKKYIRRHTKVHVHDEHETAQIGDYVSIFQSRRFSKTKRFRLGKVLKSRGDA